MIDLFAEDVLHYKIEEVLALPLLPIKLNFADGSSIQTVRGCLFISWHLWRFYREYPGLPIQPSHCVQMGAFKKGTETRLGAKIFWDIYYNCNEYHMDSDIERRDELIWKMSLTFYRIVNDIHNSVVMHLANYVTTVDLSDIAGLLSDSDIMKAKQSVIDAVNDPTAEVSPVMDKAFKDILSAVTSAKPSMIYNGIAMLARANVLDKNQLVQFIGPRGFVMATDGCMYKHPITVGYSDGFSHTWQRMTESRTGSISLYMNESALKSSEYFNRRMQLLVGVISSIKGVDCGTTDTITCMIGENDLPAYGGKYHIHNGQLMEVDINDKSIIGKMLNVRSITLCRNSDPTTICRTCFGNLYKVIPKKTNVGHYLVTEPLSAVSQRIMSTKHVLASISALYFVLEHAYRDWFKYNPENKSSIILKKHSETKCYKMRVDMDEIQGLNAVLACSDPGSLPPQRISCVTSVSLASEIDKTTNDYNWIMFDTTVGGSGSALSTDVILEIRRHGVVIKDSIVEITLEDFLDKEILISPRRNENMMQHFSQVRHFILGNDEELDKPGNIGESIVAYNRGGLSPATKAGKAVAALKNIFDEKIITNILHSEILVRACMTVNPLAMDYNLPVGGEPFVFSNARNIISNRNLSASMAFQNQSAVLTRPAAYIVRNRQGHPLDPIIR